MTLETKADLLLMQLLDYDIETGEHSMRVAELAAKIGKALHLSGDAICTLKTAALLHDIGKLCIPDSILQKPGRLTDEEYETMKQHTSKGFCLLAQLGFPREICMVALDHHERLDGNGYGKKRDFSNFSKIVCVADCFDVMSHGCMYQSPRTVDQIRSELQRCSGTQFDPEIAEVCSVLFL